MDSTDDLSPQTVSKVLKYNIKELGLQEFPCGKGSWHEPCEDKQSIMKEQLRSVCSLLDTSDVNRERSDNLVDLIISPKSPWYLNYGWSNEAKSLRQIAIKLPQVINERFVYSHFRTLKIVDKNVTEVDCGLAKLKNLEELTLSANYITNVDSKCLPPLLKVLELCANKIEDISDLCNRPPPLEHLGLGRNKLSVIGDYISGTYWPSLVSLDLSYNDLIGLADILSTLCSLPKLRNLLLQGNPVCLIPGYRGFTIDSLPDLTVFDDKHISFDEKVNFKGLSELTDCLLDETIIELGVKHIKGLPCPPEVMYPELQPDLPVIEKTYFVQLTFPVQICEKPQEVEIQTALKSSLSPVNSQTEKRKSEPDYFETKLNQPVEGHEHVVDNVRMSIYPKMSYSGKHQSLKCSHLSFDERTKCSTQVTPVNSPAYQWEEEIILNWTTVLDQRDLTLLRDFLKTGMNVALIEQMTEWNSPESLTDQKSKKEEETKETDQKDKKKNKTQKKEIEKPKPVKKQQDNSKDKAKKKKLPSEGLVKGPPKFTNVAEFHMSLDSLLNGDYECLATFTKPNDLPQLPSGSKIMLDLVDDKSKQKKSIVKESQDKKGSKDKSQDKKRSKTKMIIEDEEQGPAPLELVISVKLYHWLTVNDFHLTIKQNASCKEIEIPGQ